MTLAFFVMKVACAGGAGLGIGLIIRTLDPCKDKDSPGCSEKKKKNGLNARGDKYSVGWNQIPAHIGELA
jgi:hypothetical protein